MVQIPEWVKSKNEQLQKEKEEYQKSALPEGFEGWLTLKTGENTITIDKTTVPTDGLNKFGKKQSRYAVIQNGKKYMLSVSVILDKFFIAELMRGNETFTIIKTGKGLDTRYEIK